MADHRHTPAISMDEVEGRTIRYVFCTGCRAVTKFKEQTDTEAWEDWARLMVAESDALRKAQEAADARGTAQAEALGDAVADAKKYRALIAAIASYVPAGGAEPLPFIMGAVTFREHARRVLATKEYGRLVTGQHPVGPLSERANDEIDRIVKAAVERYAQRAEHRIERIFKKVVNDPGTGRVPITPMWVTYTGKAGYPIDREHADRDGLKVGQKYEVLVGLVDRNSTDLILRGFPGMGYNSVMFDGVDFDHPSMHRRY